MGIFYYVDKTGPRKKFDDAKMQMRSLIKAEAERFDYLQDSNKLNARGKANMLTLRKGLGNLEESLFFMM